MFLIDLLQKAVSPRSLKCEESDPLVSLEEEEDVQQIMSSRESRSTFVPSYKSLTGAFDGVMMSGPSASINGFVFFAGLPLSENFVIMNQIAMQPKRGGGSGAMMPDMMLGGRMPFYTFMANYNAMSKSSQNARSPADMEPNYTLLGRVDSQGQVQTMFLKPFARQSHLRLLGAFPNANPQFAHYEAELDVKLGDSKNCLTASLDNLEYTYTQRIDNKLFGGVRLGYTISSGAFTNGFSFRYSPRPFQSFFLKINEDQAAFSLGSMVSIDKSTKIATEFDVKAENYETSAGVGYQRSFKQYQINSSIRTSGEVKSMFSYSIPGFAKLKLFLGGNVFQEDFKCGFSLNLGMGDD